MLGNGKDQIPKCLGALSEFSVVGKFLEKSKKTIVNTTCPYFYFSKPISLLGFWEDYVQNLFVIGIPQYKAMIVHK